jgi:hypothetical protein
MNFFSNLYMFLTDKRMFYFKMELLQKSNMFFNRVYDTMNSKNLTDKGKLAKIEEHIEKYLRHTTGNIF